VLALARARGLEAPVLVEGHAEPAAAHAVAPAAVLAEGRRRVGLVDARPRDGYGREGPLRPLKRRAARAAAARAPEPHVRRHVRRGVRVEHPEGVHRVARGAKWTDVAVVNVVGDGRPDERPRLAREAQRDPRRARALDERQGGERPWVRHLSAVAGIASHLSHWAFGASGLYGGSLGLAARDDRQHRTTSRVVIHRRPRD